MNTEFITNDLLLRVLHVEYKGGIGSSFVSDEKGISYLISAKHIFGDVSHGDIVKFKVFKDDKWTDIQAPAFIHENTEVDIIVFNLNVQIFKGLTQIERTAQAVILGDEGYFFGFPLGLMTPSGGLTQGFPVALVKKATFSGYMDYKNTQVYLLDGQNNRGFSGGPAYFRKRDQSGSKWVCIGVISGYFPQKNVMSNHLGDWEYEENSGIILCYPSYYINEIIAAINI